MKSCTDCKHSDGVLCLRTAKREGHVIIGARKPKAERAKSILLVLRRCGKSGRYWEAKDGME